jgi:hypothetical protein
MTTALLADGDERTIHDVRDSGAESGRQRWLSASSESNWRNSPSQGS